ncbi:hypothetical protein [Halomontanus rarus]|uniref:hypothetical protein n=1 Tax=Halomontanus rarus TaxID=3034020 RepID=UPI0023E75D95|nr:hypothetical protein [Halovivax sp. TS33]
MATKSTHLTDTVGARLPTDYSPSLTRRTLETLEIGCECLGIQTRAKCQPDGAWYRERDRPTVKIWSREDLPDGTDEKIMLGLSGLADGWHVFHAPAEGGFECLTEAPLDRETAYEIAECVMADLSEVPDARRTGRASR